MVNHRIGKHIIRLSLSFRKIYPSLDAAPALLNEKIGKTNQIGKQNTKLNFKPTTEMQKLIKRQALQVLLTNMRFKGHSIFSFFVGQS